MNQYITGAVIKELRERKHMKQSDLAAKLAVSDKAISKWETGKGYPDITLLEPLAEALDVSVAELLSGNTVRNTNVSANMTKAKFYVCPVCGNAIAGTGEAAISCHGVPLCPLEAEEQDASHTATVTRVEDELFVQVNHPMSKLHHISFIAALCPDRLQLVKLYPESEASARFKMGTVSEFFFYCNKDGLFKLRP